MTMRRNEFSDTDLVALGERRRRPRELAALSGVKDRRPSADESCAESTISDLSGSKGGQFHEEVVAKKGGRNLFRRKKKNKGANNTLNGTASVGSVGRNTNGPPQNIDTMSGGGRSAPASEARKMRQRSSLHGDDTSGGGSSAATGRLQSDETSVGVESTGRSRGGGRSRPMAVAGSMRPSGDASSVGSSTKASTTSSRATTPMKESNTKFNLGLVYVKTKDYAKARENFQAALQIRTKMKGMNSPEAAAVHEQLGNIARDEGDKAQAMTHYETALRMIGWNELYGDGDAGEAGKRTSKLERDIDRANDIPASLKKALRGSDASEVNVTEMKERIEKSIKELESGKTTNGSSLPSRGTMTSSGDSEDFQHVPRTVQKQKSRRQSLLSELSMDTVSERHEDSVSSASQFASVSPSRRVSIGRRETDELSIESGDIDGDDADADAESAVKKKKRKKVARKLRKAINVHKLSKSHHGATGKDDDGKSKPLASDENSVGISKERSITQERAGQVPDSPGNMKKRLSKSSVGSSFSSLETGPPKQKPPPIVRDRQLSPLEKFEKGLTFYEEKKWGPAKMWFYSSLETGNVPEGQKQSEVDTAMTMEKIASCEAKMGKSDEAQNQYQSALRILRRKLGNKNETVARIITASGDLYRECGDHDLALELYEESLSVLKQVHGENHPEVARTSKNVIETHEALSTKAAEAKDFEEALFHRREILGLVRDVPPNSWDQTYLHELDEVCQLLNICQLQCEMTDYEPCIEGLSEATDVLKRHKNRNVKGHGETISKHLVNVQRLRGFVFECTGKNDKAINQYELALPKMKQLFGAQSESVAKMLIRLGVLYARRKDDNKAMTSLEEALQSLKNADAKVNWKDYIEVLDTMVVVHVRKGETHKAIDCLEERLDVSKQGCGEEDKTVADCQYRLGCLLGASDKHERALPYLASALDTRLKLYGEMHEDVAASRYSIAAVYSSLEKKDKAVEEYRTLLTAMKQVNPKGVPNVYNSMGLVHSQQGEAKEAFKSFSEALRTLKAERMHDQMLEANITINLANASVARKDYKKASVLFDNVLRLQEKKGMSSSLYRRAMFNQGLVLYEQGLYAETKEWYQEILDFLGEDGSGDIRYDTTLRNSMAKASFMQGNHNEAVTCYKKSLSLLRGTESYVRESLAVIRGEFPNHDLLVDTITSLANTYFEMRKYKEAMATFEDALREQSLSNKDRDKRDLETSQLWSLIGNCCFRTGDYQTALKYYLLSLRNRKILLDEDHPDVLKIKHDIGLTMIKSNQTESNDDSLNEATVLLEDVHSGLIKKFGEEHAEIAKIRLDLCGVYFKRGDSTKADEFCESALSILSALDLPDTHPYFKQARRWLSLIKNEDEELQSQTSSVSHQVQSWYSSLLPPANEDDWSESDHEDEYGYQDEQYEQRPRSTRGRHAEETKLQRRPYRGEQHDVRMNPGGMTGRSNRVVAAPPEGGFGSIPPRSSSLSHQAPQVRPGGSRRSNMMATMTAPVEDTYSAATKRAVGSAPPSSREQRSSVGSLGGSRPGWMAKGPAPVSARDTHGATRPRAPPTSREQRDSVGSLGGSRPGWMAKGPAPGSHNHSDVAEPSRPRRQGIIRPGDSVHSSPLF